MSVVMQFGCVLGLVASLAAAEDDGKPATIPCVQVAQDHRSFVLQPPGRPFVPWGFNYDHDEQGRLLEDYWDEEWRKVEADFQEMKQLGANVVRVHLQFGRFMTGAEQAERGQPGSARPPRRPGRATRTCTST